MNLEKELKLTKNDKMKYITSFLYEYTSPSYGLLNYTNKGLKENFKTMHSMNYDNDITLKDIKEFIEEFIEDSVVWPTTIYRGVNLNDSQYRKYIENKEIVCFNDIASWTTEEDIAINYSKGYNLANIVYVVKENRSAVMIAQFSMFYQERELLSSRFAKYKIENIELKDGIQYVYLKELNND